MKALFIGRFQPFHKGHLQVIKKILQEYDEVIIGIGSSQYQNTKDNPFSANERKQMINSVMDLKNIKSLRIILIPDIHNPPKWVEHVTSIVVDYDCIVTNSKLNKKLFSEKGYKIVQTPLYNRKNLSGKEIRKRILKDEKWENFVPVSVVDIIKKIDGITRIKKINKTP